MKFTINNNLRLLTGSLLLAGAVCCSSGSDEPNPNPGPGTDPVAGDVRAWVTSANGNRLFAEEGLSYSKVSMSPYRGGPRSQATTYQTVRRIRPAMTGPRATTC